MKKIMSVTTLGIAGLVTTGLLGLPGTASAAQSDYAKRDEDGVDPGPDGRRGRRRHQRRDHPHQRRHEHRIEPVHQRRHQQPVHRGESDHDLSRSDQTRDWTKDGSRDRKSDWSGTQQRPRPATTLADGARESRDPGIHEGDRITAEVTAMRLLGGGGAYKAYLAFDEITYRRSW